MAVLAFFIPTASARVACLVPIILGMISAFGIDKKSRFAGMLMMAIVYLSLIWAMGLATGAAQNVYVNALMERTIHIRISWIDWLVVGAAVLGGAERRPLFFADENDGARRGRSRRRKRQYSGSA